MNQKILKEIIIIYVSRGYQFLKKYFHPEVIKFKECIEIFDFENASNYRGCQFQKDLCVEGNVKIK
ncbi:unnamed protein product [Paramecium octaurelia]|uniref:Uncharacterized protein n=1 Tax=Paramecium octaurelia TaxID=43137 RepID=A0A8S1TR16_PAROT|nr:unnamed protein product [Paramecium octaurelia]